MISQEEQAMAPAVASSLVAAAVAAATDNSVAVAIPHYLNEVYWWAYVHPYALRVFERQWLVNLILWGNFDRLRDAALDALSAALTGRTVQIACVYGDLTARLATRVQRAAGSLDVVDVVPAQLHNLALKLAQQDGAASSVTLHHRNAVDLGMSDHHYDQALLFFLLHEQPEAVRRATLAEAVRVVKPGGRIVIVDYHRPHALSPFKWLFGPVLRRLEPFATDLWRHDIATWLPPNFTPARITKRTYFGGLYQKIVVTV